MDCVAFDQDSTLLALRRQQDVKFAPARPLATAQRSLQAVLI
jgi:hypothetical protein